MDPQKALELLAERVAQITEITAPPSDDGDITESGSEDEDATDYPLLDSFFTVKRSSSILSMANYSLREFEIVFEQIHEKLSSSWSNKRGKKPRFSEKEALFVTLAYPKHGGTWEFLGACFSVGASTFERTVMKVVGIVGPELYRQTVLKCENEHTMTVLKQRKHFKNHPYDLHATDVMFSSLTVLVKIIRKRRDIF